MVHALVKYLKSVCLTQAHKDLHTQSLLKSVACMGLFQTLFHWSVLMVILHCLNNFSFIISLEIKKFQFSKFILFEVVLDILDHLHLNINFRISLLISMRRIALRRIGFCLGLQQIYKTIQGKIGTLTILSLLAQEHIISLILVTFNFQYKGLTYLF